MLKIFIGTKNKHKREKLSWIVEKYFRPEIKDNLKEAPETKENFLEIAEEKAIFYSKECKCLAISTDGGAVIPAIPEWKPIETKRFAKTDKERINKLLKMMEGKKNRIVEWHEAIALADNGKLLFSEQAKAMDGQLDKIYNPQFYREGIWLCSITSFPQFNNKNFFELTDEEVEATEDSWERLKNKFDEFMQKNTPPFKY